MTIIEWLRRLNLVKYATVFKKKSVFWVTDLRWFMDFGKDFGAEIEGDDMTRITNIINGSDE